MRKFRRPKKSDKQVEIPQVQISKLQITGHKKSVDGDVIWRDYVPCDKCKNYAKCVIKTNYCQLGCVIGQQLRNVTLKYTAAGPTVTIVMPRDMESVKAVVRAIKNSFMNTRIR